MTEPTSDVTPQHKSALLVLFVTFFIDILGFGLVLTLNPYYVQRYPTLFGVYLSPGLAVGALTACYPILQLIFAPIWGRVSDRVGRRPIILLSLLGNAIAWLMFGFARSLEVLFAARMLSGVLSSASLPTVQAYIADSTPPEKRSVWIGIVVGMGFSFGFMLGPPIGGLLGTSPWPSWFNTVVGILPGGAGAVAADHLSYPAFLAAAIAFLNFLVASRRLPESLSEETRALSKESHGGSHWRQMASTLAQPRIGSALLILGLSTFAMQSLEQNIVLYGNKDASTTGSVQSWEQLTPKFVKGHEIYEIRSSEESQGAVSARAIVPPAVQSLRQAQPGLIYEPDNSLPAGTIWFRRHLIQEDTGIILFVVAFVVGMIQGGALRKLIPRLGEVKLIAIGGLIAALGFARVPEAHTFYPLMFVAAVVAVGFSFISPCLRGVISAETAAHTQGSVLGVSESVRGLAMAAGPLIGGWLFDQNPGLPFWLGAVCMFAGSLLALRLRASGAGAGIASAGETPAARASW